MNYDLRSCLRSLFELHNETTNVWTHLIGFIVFLGALHSLCHICDADNTLVELPQTSHLCGPEGLERWPLYVFLISALVCLGASTVYHLCGTANDRWFYPLGFVDYFGIGEPRPPHRRSPRRPSHGHRSPCRPSHGLPTPPTPPFAVALIVGSCFPVVYYGFGPDHPYKRTAYLWAIGLLGLAVVVCSVLCFDVPGSVFGGLRARVGLFVALGLSGVVALVHAMVAHDFSPRTVSLFQGVLQMGATYGAGIGFYATSWPERVAPPRWFDIFGSSHNYWHGFVFAAVCMHYQTVFALWEATAALPVGDVALAGI